MKTRTLLLLFCSMFSAFPACAQDGDDYVYVTDVISASDFSSGSINTETLIRNGKQYHVTMMNTKNTRFSFDKSTHGIITNSSIQQSTYLKKIVVSWIAMDNSQPSICVYGKNTVYNFSEFTDNNPENDGQEITNFTLSDNNNLQQEFTVETPSYQYIGIKKTSNYATYFTSISLTWQLFYERSGLTAGNLGTLCLPYGIKAEDMDGITAYSIAGKTVDANGVVTSVIFNEVDHIEAGKPYLFVANNNEIALKYHGTKAENPIHENGMYGVYERHPFAGDTNYSDNYYVIANNIVQAASNKSGVNANCAYIRMNEVPLYNPAQSSKRALIITGEGFTQTNITPTLLNTPTSSGLSNSAVDLSGRRVTNGTFPTISIINGKKTLVR